MDTSGETPGESSESKTSQPDAIKKGKKWWVIGWGGCLLMFIVGFTLLILAGGACWNQVQKVSAQSVSAIFGPGYKPSKDVMAIGLPLPNENLLHSTMLVDTKRGTMIFGLLMKLDPDIHAGLFEDMEALDAFMHEDVMNQVIATGKQEVDLQGMQLSMPKRYPIAKHQSIFISRGRIRQEHKAVYMPALVVLVPQAAQKLVALVLVEPKRAVPEPNHDFEPAYEAFTQQAVRLIRDSQLDERISSGAAK